MVIESNGGMEAPHEMETFLPRDGKKEVIVAKKYQMPKDGAETDYDPFTERKLDNPTSNMDTLTHLLKASLGTGILAMPKAFQCVGIINGILLTIFVAVICTHTAYLLIKCAHILYYKTQKSSMTFAEVAEACLENGPVCVRKFGYAFRIFIMVGLFVTYFGTCSVYTVLIAENIQQVLAYYYKDSIFSTDIRVLILLLLVPLILMALVRNLKYLAPVSMIANVFMGVGLAITFYYLIFTGTRDFDKVKLFTEPTRWPKFFSLTIFAMEAIGVVMPLENAMKTPRAMLGTCGVLNKGMSGVTVVYILLGFMGYLRYGDDVLDAITLNLEIADIPAQIVKISIAMAVYCTFGLQFFVCVQISWNCIKHKFTKNPLLADYLMRIVLVTCCVGLAVAVPKIAPLMGVIGAFCFSLLGLMAPAIMEIIVHINIGFGAFFYIIWKNVFIIIFGMFALVFGTKDAIEEIYKAQGN